MTDRPHVGADSVPTPEAPEPATDAPTKITVPEPLQIAIIGYTASRKEAPWGKPGWQRWIMNNLWKICPDDWTRLYDVHRTTEIKNDPDHASFLTGATRKRVTGEDVQLGERPFYCNEPEAEWPTAQAFPRDALTERFGRYFNNSVSWMIAHALAEIRAGAEAFRDATLAAVKIEAAERGERTADLVAQLETGLSSALIREYEARCKLQIFGVDMATGGEYAGQRPSCEYMLGIAAGLGIQTTVPLSSDLLKVTALYGMEDDSPLYLKMEERDKELKQRLAQARAAHEQAAAQIHRIEGAREATVYVKDVWCNPRGTRAPDATTAATPSPT